MPVLASFLIKCLEDVVEVVQTVLAIRCGQEVCGLSKESQKRVPIFLKRKITFQFDVQLSKEALIGLFALIQGLINISFDQPVFVRSELLEVYLIEHHLCLRVPLRLYLIECERESQFRELYL